MLIIPNEVSIDIYHIDYQNLLNNQQTNLFFDCDNTLITYNDITLNDKVIELFKQLKNQGFNIYIISNNNIDRINKIHNENIKDYLVKLNKPNINKFNQYLLNNNLDKSSIVIIGDQLLTDILLANKMNIYSILVKTIDKHTQKWYTKINRLREAIYLNKIKNNNLEIYKKIKEFDHE